MESRRLSLREQRILAEIESVLRQDRKLDQRLRNLRPPRRLKLLSVQRRLRATELSLLIPTTILLALAAVRSADPGIVIACCAVGAVTLPLLAGVVRDRITRRRRNRVTTDESRRLTSPDQ